MLNRRQFLIGSASLLFTTALRASPRNARADAVDTVGSAPPGASPNGGPNAGTVTFDPAAHLADVPDNFIGLSYESSQLGNDSLFAPNNKALIGHMRGLGKRGVLRIGGNSSEYCDWAPDLASLVPPSPAVAAKPRRRAAIDSAAVANLSGFLDATGWDLIYGLNLGTGTPREAADEASAVSAIVGKRLIAFQIGNEPDLYSRNGLRPTDWKMEDYQANWNSFAEAISAKVPGAAFGGPDVASNVAWIEGFAGQATRNVALLSGHYYAGGPPSNPAMDIPHLLGSHPRLDRDIPRIVAAAASARLPFRVTEANSCYSGGKLGVSNTFASALWAASYMLRLAAAGIGGVNFHGGGNGAYTPIAGSLDRGFSARPIYYGMLLAGQLAGTTLIANVSQASSKLSALDAYAGTVHGETRLVLINRDLTQPTHVTISTGSRAKSAAVWRLSAPAVDSTSGVTLAGAQVDSAGHWSPATVETIPAVDGAVTIDVPAASALVAFLR